MKTNLSHILTAMVSVVILSVIISCGESTSMREMDRADAIVDQYPDSALTILGAIDVSSLRGSEEKARHSLLSALAMLKTSAECDYDSIFAPAWAYYGKKDTPSRETMLTHYSRALLTNGDSAIAEYDNALKLSDGNKYYEAVSWLNKGVIYRDNSSLIDARRCIDRAKKIMRETTDTASIIYIHLLSASLSNAEGQSEESFDEIEEALQLAKISGKKDEEIDLRRTLARFHSYDGDHEEAVALYAILCRENEPFPDVDVIAYARSLAHTGALAEARNMLESVAGECCGNIAFYYTLSQIEAMAGNYQRALALTDSVNYHTNKEIVERMHQNLLIAQRDKKTLEEQHMREMAAGRKRENIYICIIAISVLILLTLFFRKIHLSQKKIIKNMTGTILRKDSIINEGKNEIEEKTLAIASLTSEYEAREAELLEKLLDNFRSHHNSIAKYCNELVKDKGDKLSAPLLSKMKAYLAPYKDMKYVENLEGQINRIMENVIGEVKANLDLSDTERSILVYDICGFNYQVIGVLLSVSSQTAATKKSRLKKKLIEHARNSGALLKRYVPMIGSQEKG